MGKQKKRIYYIIGQYIFIWSIQKEPGQESDRNLSFHSGLGDILQGYILDILQQSTINKFSHWLRKRIYKWNCRSESQMAIGNICNMYSYYCYCYKKRLRNWFIGLRKDQADEEVSPLSSMWWFFSINDLLQSGRDIITKSSILWAQQQQHPTAPLRASIYQRNYFIAMQMLF